ncbi:FABP family protein [Georgenia faecalis]|uniref:Ferric nitrobindin-like protein n=1 Tax=Georgenia faecalis TaxID=2483799 RepID=A0ABV9DBS9_9MICO|nr:FABP family protein [Georgenia faecalis]
MTFRIPEGLAPELYPLAWLVGSWRGYGVLAYPNVPEQPFVQEMSFDHDGGPYLRCTSTLWMVDVEHSESVPQEMPGSEGADLLAKAHVWSSESAYWRPVPKRGTGAEDAADGTTPTELEVLVADPSGHLSVYLGTVRGPRIELATDAVVRTATAAEVSAASRMYGLVHGELMWAEDLAAFGHELQPYASGRLSRQEAP